MPRDVFVPEPSQPTPVRSAVLDLISRAGGARPEEADFLAELRRIVASGRSRSDELWAKYRGAGDERARIYARYPD